MSAPAGGREHTGLALSIQQPWAWLIVNGYKPIENRDWSTNLRGRIYIHAGKKQDGEALLWVWRRFPDIVIPRDLPTGGIVGEAEIFACFDERSAHANNPWFVGRYGFGLRDARPLELRPCRGMLGFFRPDFAARRASPEGDR